jgi:hypothetical protein
VNSLFRSISSIIITRPLYVVRVHVEEENVLLTLGPVMSAEKGEGKVMAASQESCHEAIT